jgi:UDP-perosamine 4-acetyltransferase
MDRKIICLGAGGHAKACHHIIEDNGYSIMGYLDPRIDRQYLNGIPILGDDDALPYWLDKCCNYFITVGQPRNAHLRQTVFLRIYRHDKIEFPKFVSLYSTTDPSAFIGPGSIIMDNAHVGPDVYIGQQCIINTGTIIEHDCKIGAFTHLCIGSTIAGGTYIGAGCTIGTGTVIREGLVIPDNLLIPMGAVVKCQADIEYFKGRYK